MLRIRKTQTIMRRKRTAVNINWPKYDAYSRTSRQGHSNMFKKVDKSMCILSRDMKAILEKIKLNFWKTKIIQHLRRKLSHEFNPTADFSLCERLYDKITWLVPASIQTHGLNVLCSSSSMPSDISLSHRLSSFSKPSRLHLPFPYTH